MNISNDYSRIKKEITNDPDFFEVSLRKRIASELKEAALMLSLDQLIIASKTSDSEEGLSTQR